MALVTEKKLKISNKYVNTLKEIKARLLAVTGFLKKLISQTFTLIFVHKHEPSNKDARKAYLSHESKTRGFAPKNLDSFSRY